jgi:DNA processing protein
MSTDRQESESLLAALTLSCIPGIGPRTQSLLLSRFDTAANVLTQTTEALMSVDGVGPRIASSIVSASSEQAAILLDECRQLGVNLLQRSTDVYPASLENVDDAPAVLYCRGDYQQADSLAIGIVGSRRCTAYGRKQAEKIAGSLARAGFTVISGLARGIDAAAHRGALNAGGRTIAVLATGVREIYPPEHADLAIEVSRNGCLLSEHPLHQKPRPGLFPQRNRIISGLSLGVVVIEASRNSGALYTARHAYEQGREVFAVPGPIDSLASAGCHDLIRDGAILIRNVDDILAELGPLSTPTTTSDNVVVRNPREMKLNDQEQEVLNAISTSPVHVDDILRATKLDHSRVLSTLTVLEMRRFIRRLPGNVFQRS